MTRSKVKVTRDKNVLSAADTPWVRTNGMRSLQTDAAAADEPISWLPGGVFRELVCGVCLVKHL